jgi:hypothetical protein
LLLTVETLLENLQTVIKIYVMLANTTKTELDLLSEGGQLYAANCVNIPTVILFKVGAVARDHDTLNSRFVAVCPIPIASPRDLSFDK